ncbi:MAG: exo-alpha-sialidase, partial [Clostridia bacterium]|nr:exo-alpha-sialidase [Clostridia bacterium]
AVYGYLKLHALAEMNVELADLYDGLAAYSSVEVDSGNVSGGQWRNSGRGGEGDYYTMPDGTLVMIYTGYPIGGVDGDYADNVLKAIQSTDGGYTWGEPWITLRKQDGNTNLMCASYHYMANGDLAILYIEKLPGEIAHVLLRRSTDFGRSWGEPICITEEPLGYSILSSAVNGWHLSDGRFVVAVNYNYATSDCHGSDRSVSYMAYSDDDGYTWKKSATTVVVPNSSVEPVIAELANGNLIMTMRTRKENSIYQTISTDRGITWAQPVRAENINTPSSTNSVHTIPATGDLMLVWNDEVYDPGSRDNGNGNRDPLSAAISTDSGLTYKNQRNIVEGGGTWACIRFYGRSMQLQYSSNMKVIDVADLYHTREGGKTVADLPVAATPTSTYENGWLNGVSGTLMYSLDGGKSWSFCGGSSVNVGEVDGDILVKDIGTHEYAPSGVQTVNSTVVLASDLGIVPGNVTKAQLNAFINMASSGSYTFKFDSGVYFFPATINLPSNTAIIGSADTVFMLNEGASGTAASPQVIYIGNQVDNVRISNITVKGYNDTVFCPTYAANNIGIRLHSALRVNIDHVNVVGFADSGIKATTMGLIFWDDNLSYDQRQAYFKGLQLSDCHIEKCYYGLHLGERAEYCQITNLAAGYNNIGCVNSGGNNSFVNCWFNKNNTGFYLLCTNKPNHGHGGATGCSFNHNRENAIIIENNQIGFSFTGCQIFDSKIKQTDSYGTLFSGCILGSVTLNASGAAGANLLAGCFFQTDRNDVLAGNDGTFTVTDCIDVPATAVALTAKSPAEPQMMLLSATSNAPRIYGGATTINASELGITAGNVSEEALNALIAKANEGGYTFKFDSGVYVFPKTIALPSDTAIIGDACTVFMLSQNASGKSATPAVISIGSYVDNVRISNLTIKGYNDSAYPSYKANTSGIKINGAL